MVDCTNHNYYPYMYRRVFVLGCYSIKTDFSQFILPVTVFTLIQIFHNIELCDLYTAYAWDDFIRSTSRHQLINWQLSKDQTLLAYAKHLVVCGI